jgi:hypothetical protein
MTFTHSNAVELHNPGVNIMARTLMQDWLSFTHQTVASLTRDDSAISPMSPNHPKAE